jgi:hypothetical protein
VVRNNVARAAFGLLFVPGIATAIGIGVIGGDPTATAFDVSTQLGVVQPTSSNCDPTTGDCTFVFNNDTGAIINSLMFSVTIAPNLTDPPASDNDLVADNFTCSQNTVTSGYFETCNVTYDASTGLLTYSFSGVTTADNDETCPDKDCELGEKEGIPPAAPGYPQFRIELTGWLADATVNDPMPIFPNGLPTITGTFTTVPEPSTLFVLVVGMVLLLGAVELRRRRVAAPLHR